MKKEKEKRKYSEEWHKGNREDIAKYLEEHREEIAERKAGNIWVISSHRISLPLNVPFVWHHVNKRDVVAIQKEIHKTITHKCGDGKLEGVVG